MSRQLTKGDIINVVMPANKNDLQFLLGVASAALDNMPANYRQAVVNRLYLKYVHEGSIFRCVSVKNNGVMYFGSMKELMAYIKPMYPKAQPGAIYTNAKRNTGLLQFKPAQVYDHVFSYLESKEEL